MKWFSCFGPGPVLHENQNLKDHGVEVVKAKSLKPSLVKQDSAYVVDRTAFQAAQGPDSTTAAPEQRKPDSAAPRGLSFEEQYEEYSGVMPSSYSTRESIDGRAANLKDYGPPKPSCNEARLANLKELGLLDKASGDPQIQHIMQLMCTVFNTKSALVALVGDDRIFVHDAINFKKGDFGWRMSLCAHTLTPANHQVMVVEDAQKDARFAHLPLIVHDKVRFYAGTPIVSSRGHRLGTVCFAGPQPRKFDAEGSQMLINMAELVTRELERDWVQAQEAKKHTSKGQDMPELLRAVECFNEAVMFIDTSKPGWRILHLNSAAQAKLKLYDVAVSTEEGSESRMWDMFRAASDSKRASTEPWTQHEEDVKAGHMFQMKGMAFSTTHHESNARQALFNLTFRCAATAPVDKNAAAVGAPAFLPTTASNHQFYFVTLGIQQSSANSNQSIFSAMTGSIDEDVPFEGVELGALLGKGGYGSVYRGLRQREGEQSPEIVAIKVIANSGNLRMHGDNPLEATITGEAHHPNVVNTLDYATTSEATEELGSDSGSGVPSTATSRGRSSGRSEGRMWMMLEFCDCGSLQEASEKGHLRTQGQVDMSKVLSVAADVAAGMAFLHQRGVAHGDLTGGNVLLASNPNTPAGYTAKIADFGLARNVDLKSRIETRTYGTVTHMPPELLESGILTKATDSFAFGVLLWEMWHGVRAWSSLTFAQIITAVVVNKRSLRFDGKAPAKYARLATALMSSNVDERPTFEQALTSIQDMQQGL